MSQVTFVRGDLTEQRVDAIVNAANQTLLGGGGVDGAIHRAAGPDLLAECRRLGGCRPGDAKITGGYRLPARHVIHTVGPVFGAAGGREAEILASCHRRSLEVAREHRLKTVAFPAISTGAFGYPLGQAAAIAVPTVSRVVGADEWFDEVRFVLWTEEAAEAYRAALRGAQ